MSSFNKKDLQPLNKNVEKLLNLYQKFSKKLVENVLPDISRKLNKDKQKVKMAGGSNGLRRRPGKGSPGKEKLRPEDIQSSMTVKQQQQQLQRRNRKELGLSNNNVSSETQHATALALHDVKTTQQDHTELLTHLVNTQSQMASEIFKMSHKQDSHIELSQKIDSVQSEIRKDIKNGFNSLKDFMSENGCNISTILKDVTGISVVTGLGYILGNFIPAALALGGLSTLIIFKCGTILLQVLLKMFFLIINIWTKFNNYLNMIFKLLVTPIPFIGSILYSLCVIILICINISAVKFILSMLGVWDTALIGLKTVFSSINVLIGSIWAFIKDNLFEGPKEILDMFCDIFVNDGSGGSIAAWESIKSVINCFIACYVSTLSGGWIGPSVPAGCICGGSKTISSIKSTTFSGNVTGDKNINKLFRSLNKVGTINNKEFVKLYNFVVSANLVSLIFHDMSISAINYLETKTTKRLITGGRFKMLIVPDKLMKFVINNKKHYPKLKIDTKQALSRTPSRVRGQSSVRGSRVRGQSSVRGSRVRGPPRPRSIYNHSLVNPILIPVTVMGTKSRKKNKK